MNEYWKVKEYREEGKPPAEVCFLVEDVAKRYAEKNCKAKGIKYEIVLEYIGGR